MRKGLKKLNHAGMSLVELIVAILIIGLLSAGGVVGIGYLSSMDATGAAEKLNSLLTRTRVMTLSYAETEDVEAKILLDGDNYYGKIYVGGNEMESVRLGKKSLDIVVYGDTPITIGTGSPGDCTIAYKKANGAFDFPASDKHTYFEISGTETKKIYLVEATGRSYIE